MKRIHRYLFAIIIPVFLFSGCGPTLKDVRVYVNGVQQPEDGKTGNVKIIFNANRITTVGTDATIPASALGAL